MLLASMMGAVKDECFTGYQIHSIYEVPLDITVFLAFIYLAYKSWLSWKETKMNAVKHITIGFIFLTAYFGLRSMVNTLLIIYGIHPNILHGVEAVLALLSILFFVYSLKV
jgi:hypothetical protein